MTQSDVDSVRSAYLEPYRGWTLKSYGYRLDQWFAWCAGQGIAPLSVRRTHVEQYVNHKIVEVGLRPSSVLFSITPVRGFYRIAHSEDLIDPNPAANIRLPRVLRGPRRLGLDRQDVQALLKVGGQRGGRYQAAAYLLGCLALSSNEARSIRIEDFSTTVRGHRVLEFIGRAGRTVRMPLPVPVVRALEEAAQGRSNGPLMLRKDGLGPVSARSLRTMVRSMGAAAGISTRLHPELLRVSCIINALDSGASVRKVADLARHLDVASTVRFDQDRTGHDHHAVHTLMAYLASDEEQRA